jgi:hypothetical protein
MLTKEAQWQVDRTKQSLKRLQAMRKTAKDKINYYDKIGNSEKFYWWSAQYIALDQAISIIIDPDQLTIWEEKYEEVLS